MVETPIEKIKQLLSNKMSLELANLLPDKWEKIGDVVIIKLNEKFNNYNVKIGKTYAEVLHCKTVLNDFGGISGIYREPNVELLYGSKDTETVHKENGIRYKLDVRKIMFSSGNMDERICMATISDKNETVVDLFAGIGYFTLPILWDGNLVARIDCKADRKEKVMHVHFLALEPGHKNTDAFVLALAKELISFQSFNGCKSNQVHHSSPADIKARLLSTLRKLT